MKKVLLTVLVVAMTLAMLVGCAAPTTSPSAETPASPEAPAEPETPAETEEAPAETEEAPAAGGKTVGLSMSDLNVAFFAGMEQGFQEAAAAAGHTLIVSDAAREMTKQISDIEDLINQAPDMIMVNALDSGAMGEIHKKLLESGIPFMYVDRGADGVDDVLFIETDNYDAGVACGDYLVEKLTERYGEPKGKIVVMEGQPAASSGIARGEGFFSVIDQYPGIEVVSQQIGDFNQETSLNVMTNVLAAQPEIDAVFNYNDDNALGVANAIDAANRYYPLDDPKHIINIGVDGIYSALEAVRDGKIDMTYAQEPLEMAKIAFEYADRIFAGETDLKGRIGSPITKITIDNWDDPNHWGHITNPDSVINQ